MKPLGRGRENHLTLTSVVFELVSILAGIHESNVFNFNKCCI